MKQTSGHIRVVVICVAATYSYVSRAVLGRLQLRVEHRSMESRFHSQTKLIMAESLNIVTSIMIIFILLTSDYFKNVYRQTLLEMSCW